MNPMLLPASLPSLLSWLLQTTALLTAGWLFYRVALRNERFFHFNRRFLLLTPWLALLLPGLAGAAAPLMRNWLPAAAAPGTWLMSGWLPTVTVQGNAPETSPLLPLSYWLMGLYGAGVLLLLGRLGVQLLQLWRTTRHWPREQASGYTLVYTGGRRPVSSFGKQVFWDETAGLSAAESQVVLAHEVAHVRQGHTYERLALEAARALLWPIPLVHLFPRALELTHEFLADAAALHTAAPLAAASSESYVTVLARLALRQLHPRLPLSHSFTHSLTLTRIRMLSSTTSPRRWKQWLLLPFSALLLLALGCEQEFENTPPPPPPPAFTSGEQMPEYEGGQDQLMADISKAIKYPAAARAEKLEGKVFVRFIVDSRGRVQAAEVLKGIEHSVEYPDSNGQQQATRITTPGAQALNEAALNAVRSLPGRWKPGRQDGKAVDVMYTVPITFSLAASAPLELGWALYARFRGC